MTKTIAIEFTGGFHGYNTAKILAKVEDKGTYLGAYVTDSQARRLNRIFCGIATCICGGVSRAEMSLPAGYTSNSDGASAGLIAYQDKQ